MNEANDVIKEDFDIKCKATKKHEDKIDQRIVKKFNANNKESNRLW